MFFNSVDKKNLGENDSSTDSHIDSIMRTSQTPVSVAPDDCILGFKDSIPPTSLITFESLTPLSVNSDSLCYTTSDKGILLTYLRLACLTVLYQSSEIPFEDWIPKEKIVSSLSSILQNSIQQIAVKFSDKKQFKIDQLIQSNGAWKTKFSLLQTVTDIACHEPNISKISEKQNYARLIPLFMMEFLDEDDPRPNKEGKVIVRPLISCIVQYGIYHILICFQQGYWWVFNPYPCFVDSKSGSVQNSHSNDLSILQPHLYTSLPSFCCPHISGENARFQPVIMQFSDIDHLTEYLSVYEKLGFLRVLYVIDKNGFPHIYDEDTKSSESELELES